MCRIAVSQEQPPIRNPIHGLERGNVAYWHTADVQRLPGLGPLTGALPTFGIECRFTVAFPTQRQAVLKVAV